MRDSGTSRRSGKSGAPSADRDERRKLTAAALDGMLGRLDSDRERAGEHYEALRRRLQGLFRWWGSENSFELADRTLDRVAIKLDEGAAVSAEALPGYVRGVARLIFHESLRERQREERALRDLPLDAVDPDREGALAALDNCLDTLDAADRQLIVDYYAAHGTSMIEARRRLASELQLSPTALRIRAHRLRLRMEECLAAGHRGGEG
jgi:DNA-directed RNA polymerase specialized sigma24 family protein